MSDLIQQITADLKKQIDDYEPKMEVRDVGNVVESGDGIARVDGLGDVQSQELVQFENGVMGIHIGHPGECGGFYADVFGSEGRGRAGIYTEPFVADTAGKAVDLAPLDLPAKDSPFRMAYEQIADYLDGGPLPHCTNQHFVAVNELGFGGIESVHSGARVELPNANRSRKIFANG